MTWQEIYTKTQKTAGDTSAATLIQIKQDLNTANKRFNAAINNYFNRRSKSTNLVADQQYYQLPPDCVRVMGVDFLIDTGQRRPLTQVRSEYLWRRMNSTNQSGNWLTNYHVKGADEVGIFPIPSAALSDGLIIYYVPKGPNMSVDDYTTGTVTVTEGSTTVTGSGTTFTAAMVGRAFKVTDGSDGYDYKVGGYTSATVITLEEPYIGVSGAGKTFNIGEAPLFPSEYHDALMDYALSRFFEMNQNPERARYHASGDYKRPGRWETAILDAKEQYASSSMSQVITEDPGGGNPWMDNTRTITE